MIIAIDGHSSTGKSTLAKQIALELNFIHIDSGAMYRAVTHYFQVNDIDYNDIDKVIKDIKNIHISFNLIDGNNNTFLNDKNVEEEIRSMKVSSKVSEVARIPEVRKAMVRIQQFLAADMNDIVMDGRDIGTVVFPNADIKFFVTADIETRTQRRFDELNYMGKSIPIEEVTQNLKHRDDIDSNREHSPLIKAEDAIEIDNTYMNRDEQLSLVLRYISHYQSK